MFSISLYGWSASPYTVVFIYHVIDTYSTRLKVVKENRKFDTHF